MLRFVRKFPPRSARLQPQRKGNVQQRKYTLSAPNVPRKPASLGTAYTITTLSLVTAGTIGYAKYDSEFRDWLKEKAPFTDQLLKFLFEEDLTFKESYDVLQDSLIEFFRDLVNMSDTNIKPQKPITETSSEYKPPTPGLNPKPLSSDTNDEKMVHKEPVFGSKVKPTSNVPLNIQAIETELADAAQITVRSYNEAIDILRDYTVGLDQLVNQSFERINANMWSTLKLKAKKKDEMVVNAEKHAEDAKDYVERLKHKLQNKEIQAPPTVLSTVSNNVAKVEQELAEARENFQKQLQEARITEIYRDKVLDGRKHYQEELEMLCPSVNLEGENLNISGPDIDLFILHARKNVLFLQKELANLETRRDLELQRALERAKQAGGDVTLVDEQIKSELEKERRELVMDYEKKTLYIQANAEKELRAQLKRQSLVHSDHLADAIKAKEDEIKRKYERELNEQLLKAKLEYKTQLAGMMGRLKGMNSALKVRADADRSAHKAQALWSACQALYNVVKTGVPGVSWRNQLRPLKTEIEAISNAAASGDELVDAVVAGIPREAYTRGVFNEDALRQRFLKVEKVARRLALVPDSGSRLPVYLMSFVQSILLVKAANPISERELNDDITDFRNMHTYDILARARYWVDRGDFTQTLKYMNLLTGASRVVAIDWMNEARILLETQQAANTLMAHAAACGLIYL